MLDPQALRVESFPTTRADEAIRGTVRAQSWTQYTCPEPSCAYVCRTRHDTPCVVEQA